MLAKTHLAFGILLGLTILNYFEINSILFLAVTGIASIFPDIDCPNSKISNNIPLIPKLLTIFVNHRGIIHSLLFAILTSYTVFFFFGTGYGVAVFTGYISHILIDSLTKEGINFLHPFANLRLSGFIQTGTTSELVIFLTLIALIIIKIFQF